ncbi:MAG: DegT/DnrJ/EryC1/StrS family aminotransferase [Betaproteobacteria bacterium]|nr:DegT/DnrJ/EryC1/StrS family aminotransferase [Betaproteobacteria bacterium]
MTQFAIRLLVPDFPSADELLPWLRRIDASRWYSNFGPLVQEFESSVSGVFPENDAGALHLTTTASGTSALQLALSGLSLPRGSRVLVPSFTFPATALAILHAGLEPVFTEVDGKDWCLSPAIARAVAGRTDLDLVLPVATFGRPLPAGEWDAFARNTGIPVLADAAAALGYQAIATGMTAAFSLHATKPHGIGEGGLLVSRDPAIIDRARQLSNFGFRKGMAQRDGTNAKLSEYAAAVGLAQLARWPRIQELRRRLWTNYRERLAAIPSVRLQDGPEGWVPAVVGVMTSVAAAEVSDGLASSGIETRSWYCPPLTHQPAFAAFSRAGPDGTGDLPVTDALARRLVGLPFHTGLTDQQTGFICDCVRQLAGRETGQ